jgi:hypothetical protein
MHVPSTVVVPRNIWVKIGRAGLSLATASGTTKSRKPTPAPMKITPDPVYLRKDENDEVEWFSEDNHSYTIRFRGKTPFQSTEFVAPVGGSVCSGPPNAFTRPGEKYKYEIWSDSICVADPQIIIKPSQIIIKP